MIAYQELDHESYSDFRHLCPPEIHPLLQQPPGGTILIGAYAGGEPAGLLAARGGLPGKQARLLSVAVLPDARRRGIGTGLVRKLEDILGPRESPYLLAEFVTNTDESDPQEAGAFLTAAGFALPVPGIAVRSSALAPLQRVPWMKLTLPAAFTLSPWSSWTEDERQEAAAGAGSAYPEILSPFAEEEEIDPARSMLLRHNGKVAGWMVLEPFGEYTVLLKTMFVYPPYQRMGRGLAMAAEVLRRLFAEGFYRSGIYFAEADNEGMMAFARRHLEYPGLKKETLWRTYKGLGPTAGG
ncbi:MULTISPECIES: GNAT family N-acetyltransferase [Paenibacillus]|uniref:GNAT family N-acetyltransferase n=1 Tax=Paenibacillus TaxID=44249 RepID=UPI0022B87638|nr:GNAT family N-acetyltransferase [Paenibacillus caseinilyticus]MCZ8520412.1 GNAT family N-acetyltransferase [Paenibacillus caseinilyticus]